jgi:hypothetical protein
LSRRTTPALRQIADLCLRGARSSNAPGPPMLLSGGSSGRVACSDVPFPGGLTTSMCPPSERIVGVLDAVELDWQRRQAARPSQGPSHRSALPHPGVRPSTVSKWISNWQSLYRWSVMDHALRRIRCSWLHSVEEKRPGLESTDAGRRLSTPLLKGLPPVPQVRAPSAPVPAGGVGADSDRLRLESVILDEWCVGH